MNNRGLEETRAVSRRDLLRGVAAFAATAAIAKGAAASALVGTPGPKPVRFALLGDWGNGDSSTGRVASLMAAEHDRSPLDMVVTAGDNIYPNGAADKFGSHFERPFEPVIRRHIPVYATLGNHDVRSGGDSQMRYPLFNMGGRNYYSIPAGGGAAELFMLDSNAMDRRQLDWLDRELGRSSAQWKIAVFHHPTFSSGKRHGSDEGLRRDLHPILVRHGVQAAFSGHDHIYQRVTPQDGVQYFVSGAGGKIRRGDLDRNQLVAAGYDDDSHFMMVEADATKLVFRAVNVDGVVVDEGALVAKAARVTAQR